MTSGETAFLARALFSDRAFLRGLLLLLPERGPSFPRGFGNSLSARRTQPSLPPSSMRRFIGLGCRSLVATELSLNLSDAYVDLPPLFLKTNKRKLEEFCIGHMLYRKSPLPLDQPLRSLFLYL
jgi:hypothetical protein